MRVRQAHDVGLRDTEVVDTAAEHIERSGDGGLGLLLQQALDVGVRALERDVRAVGADEQLGERTAARQALVGLHEVADVVARCTLLEGLVGLGNRLLEGRIVLAVTGKSLDDILDLNLQHDVHTALQVQTQIQFLLLALLVGELAESHVEDRHVLDRIQIVLFGTGLLLERELCGILGRLFLYASCLERKRELINARERQKHRDEFNETFALHLREKNLLLFVCFVCNYHGYAQ